MIIRKIRITYFKSGKFHVVTLKFWVFYMITKTFRKIHAVTLRFTKLFHHDFFAYKTLANVYLKALRLLYAYLCDSPFQIPSVLTFSPTT